MLYDIKGNAIDTVSSDAVRKALVSAVNDGSVNVGSVVGATLSTTFGNTYGETAYANMLTAYNENPNSCIPFFISTDQHGRGLYQHRWVNNIDTDGMNMANINLGDTVVDSFSPVDMEEFYSQTWQVKNFIGVVGNHEYKSSVYPLSDAGVSRAFGTTNYLRRLNPSNENCYTVIDGLHNVKYVVIEEFVVNDDSKGYTPGFTTETAEWIIHELSINDGYDIIVLKHWPLAWGEGAYTDRDGNVLTDVFVGYCPELPAMLSARKNKGTGTITDIDGVSHAYDFSDCSSEMLCCLHGHCHSERYFYTGGLLCYIADWFGNKQSCVFGMVDRKNNKLRIWKFDGTASYDELALDLDVAE